MSDTTSEVKGLGAKKAILKRLNASEEEIENIGSIDEANELIAYLREEAKKNTTSIKKAGIPVLNHAPPESEVSSEPISKWELNDPLQPDISRLNKLDQEGRILKLYNKQYPNGRLV